MSRLLGFGLVLGVSVMLTACGVRQNPAPVVELNGFMPQTAPSNEPVSLPGQPAVASTHASSESSQEKAPQLVMKPAWKYIKNKPKKASTNSMYHHDLKPVVQSKPKVKPSKHIVVKKVHKVEVAKAPAKKPVQAHTSSKSISVPVKGKIVSIQNNNLLITSRANQPVVSVKGGSVVYTGPSIKGTGKLVIIKHKDGVLSAYSHLGKTSVTEGQAVLKGQMIGRVSTQAGEQTIAFEVRQSGNALNPQKWLNT